MFLLFLYFSFHFLMQKTDFRTLQKEENGEEDNDAYTHDTPKKRRTVDVIILAYKCYNRKENVL